MTERDIRPIPNDPSSVEWNGDVRIADDFDGSFPDDEQDGTIHQKDLTEFPVYREDTLSMGSQDLRDAIEATQAPRVDQKVLDVLHEGALLEDLLRRNGASTERIRERVGRTIRPELARLGLRGVDTSHAYPESVEVDAEVVPLYLKEERIDTRMPVSVEEFEKMIDDLVDSGQASYFGAREEISEKYYVPKS